MVDCDQEKTTTETVDVSLKRKQLLSNAMKRTSDWYVPETYIFLLLLTSLDRMRIHEKEKNNLYLVLVIGFSPKRFLVMLQLKLEEPLFNCIRYIPILLLLIHR